MDFRGDTPGSQPFIERPPSLWESFHVSLTFRARRILAVLAVLVAAVVAVPRFLTHVPYQRLGVSLDWNTADGRPRVFEVVGPPGMGLLEKNDVLLELDGQPLTRELIRERYRKPEWLRGPITLTIERRGEARSLAVPPLHLSAWQRVRLFTLPTASVIAAPLVAILLVWRRPDLSAAWVFLWFAILQALGTVWSLYRFPQVDIRGAFKVYLDAYHALVMWFPASFLHFMTVFPRPRWRPGGRFISPWFWMVVLAYATPLAMFALARPIGRTADDLYVWFQAAAFPLGTLLLLERYARPARPDWHPMARERVIALIVALALIFSTLLEALVDDPRVSALFSMPVVRLLSTVIIFTWLMTPLLIAYLIANDPVFDPRRLIVRSLPYALLTGVLAAIYLAIVLGAQRLFAAATGEEAILFNVVAALTVAFAFAPARERFQRALDRLYGRDMRALRVALDQAGSELLGALDRDEVRGAVEAAIVRGLKRPVAIDWPELGLPRIAPGEEVRSEERGAIESLLLQAGIRLENLTLQAERAAAERNALELREAATRAELRALHAQVQPHFLFNALNALSFLTETDPPAAQRFTERIADMLRYTIEAGERPAALLSEEIGFVEDYLGVARERYENPLSFEYHGDRELLSAAVPPLLLQPLVENSLKHGCAANGRALHLSLEARADDGWFTLTFADDGGATANGGPGFGVGLQNLEQRVRRFGGTGATMAAARRVDGGFEVKLRWRTNTANTNGHDTTGANGKGGT